MNKIKEFINNVRAEMKRVTWPSREQLMGSTVIVMVVWIMLSIYVFGADRILQSIVKLFLV